MGRRTSFICVAVLLVIGALSAPASADASADASASATSEESPAPSDMPTTVSQAFPDGLPPDAVQIDATTVSFDGGQEVLYLAGIPFSDCLSGELCLWANSNFGGQTVVITACCYWIDLSDYGFNNEMSSWRNHRTEDALWSYGSLGSGTVRCMNGPDNMSYVGDTDNDKASSAKLKSVSGTC